MALEMNWTECKHSDRLNSEAERNITFVCGLVMARAGVRKVTMDTVGPLYGWTRFLEDQGPLMYADGAPLKMSIREWLKRIGMTANVQQITAVQRGNRFVKEWAEYSAALAKSVSDAHGGIGEDYEYWTDKED